MKNIEKDRIENLKSPLQLNQKIRTFSPQPWLSYIGFRKKAFFNKRQGILKKGLKLKKINIFTDIKEDFPSYLLRSNIKRRFLSPKMCERSDINYSNWWDSITFDLKSCNEDTKSLQQNQTMPLNHNKKLGRFIVY